VKYACLDAYASVLVYQMIEKLKDPIRGPAPNSLEPDTKVHMKHLWSGHVFLDMYSSAAVDRLQQCCSRPVSLDMVSLPQRLDCCLTHSLSYRYGSTAITMRVASVSEKFRTTRRP